MADTRKLAVVGLSLCSSPSEITQSHDIMTAEHMLRVLERTKADVWCASVASRQITRQSEHCLIGRTSQLNLPCPSGIARVIVAKL
jgi:hypothetical protein